MAILQLSMNLQIRCIFSMGRVMSAVYWKDRLPTQYASLRRGRIPVAVRTIDTVPKEYLIDAEGSHLDTDGNTHVSIS